MTSELSIPPPAPDVRPRSSRRPGARRLLIALALVGVSIVIWLGLENREPRCLGKPVSYWVARLEGVNPEQSRPEWKRLAQAGPEAVPVYEALLRASASKAALAYRRFWMQNQNRWPGFLMRRLPPPRAFYQGGNFQSLALSAISQTSPPATNAIPVLRGLLAETPDQGLRVITVSVLGRMGPAACAALPQLLAHATTADPNLQQALCFTLDRIGVFDERVITTFERLATNAHPLAVQQVARVLGRIGSDPALQPRMTPPLLALARSIYPGIRTSALWAMGDLAVAPDSVVEALQAACQPAEVEDVRRFARVALERLERGQKIQRPWLEKLARHEDLEVRLIAARALCERAGQTNAYVQALGERLAQGDETGAWRAIEKLAALAPASASAVPLIARVLSDPEPRLRGKAAIALGQLGAAAKSARPALTEALQDEHKNVRDAAKEALDLIPE